MSKSLPSLLPAGLVVDRAAVGPDRVVVAVRARAAAAAPCPLCRRLSRRVHSRYVRRLGDLPSQGRVARLDLQVRCFRSADPGCARRVFAERLPAVASPRVRRTVRLAEAQRHIALSAGGEAGARLASRLTMRASGDTLLRLIRATPLPAAPVPRVVGIDDWAWRRGRRYGTLIVDLERDRPVDLLPDRDARTVGAWLDRHPGIEVVARDRDRASAYADGVRSGAPAAVQVADRWHFLRNLGDALAGALNRHHRDLRAAAAVQETQGTQPPPAAAPAPVAEPHAPDRHAARRARFDEAMELRGQGWPVRRTARAVGVDRQTAQGWLRPGRRPRGSSVDRPAGRLNGRWAEDCHNAAQLWREIQAHGVRGRLRTAQRWAAGRRGADTPPSGLGRTMRAWPVAADPERTDAAEQRFVDALVARSAGLAGMAGLERRFDAMVRRQEVERLDGWLAGARGSALAGFAGGLVRDLDAVRAALVLPWSTGPVEGQASRLKTIKQTMCGRAGLQLLRQRVLHAA